MTKELASQLFQSGRSHALSSDLLYRAALSDAIDQEIEDPEKFAFNGTYSLSTHYLLGLGLELMLKAAYVAHGGAADDRALRDIGHDLIAAFDAAEAQGFHSDAPYLREMLGVLREPFLQHWFRYTRPSEMPLPGDWAQVSSMLQVLDEELQALIWAD